MTPSFEAEEGLRRCHLDGRPITTVSADVRGVSLEIRAPAGSLELRIEGPFELRRGSTQVGLDPARPVELGPVLAQLSVGVESLTAHSDGRLDVRLETGDRLFAGLGVVGRVWRVSGAGDVEALGPFLTGTD